MIYSSPALSRLLNVSTLSAWTVSSFVCPCHRRMTYTPILSSCAVLTPVVQTPVVGPDSHAMFSASTRTNGSKTRSDKGEPLRCGDGLQRFPRDGSNLEDVTSWLGASEDLQSDSIFAGLLLGEKNGEALFILRPGQLAAIAQQLHVGDIGGQKRADGGQRTN